MLGSVVGRAHGIRGGRQWCSLPRATLNLQSLPNRSQLKQTHALHRLWGGEVRRLGSARSLHHCGRERVTFPAEWSSTMAAKSRHRVYARAARKDNYRSRTLTDLLHVSENDVQRAIEDVKVRGAFDEDRHFPASDVVARILAERLVHKVPAGSIRIRKGDLRVLSRKVEHALGNRPASISNLPAEAQPSASRRGRVGRLRAAGGRLVTTATLPKVSNADVRRAAEDVRSRSIDPGGSTDVFVFDVVADLLAAHLASRLQADPDTVKVHRDDVRGLTEEVRAVLGAGPSESPWRAAIGPVLRAETACAVLGASDPEELVKMAAANVILVLRTSDGHDVLPCYQFTPDGVIPGFSEVLQAVAGPGDQVTWTAAAWLRTSLRILGDRSIVDALLSGDVGSAVDAARRTAARWAS